MKGFEICTHVVVNLLCMAMLLSWQPEGTSPFITATLMSLGVIAYWTGKYFLSQG